MFIVQLIAVNRARVASSQPRGLAQNRAMRRSRSNGAIPTNRASNGDVQGGRDTKRGEDGEGGRGREVEGEEAKRDTHEGVGGDPRSASAVGSKISGEGKRTSVPRGGGEGLRDLVN